MLIIRYLFLFYFLFCRNAVLCCWCGSSYAPSTSNRAQFCSTAGPFCPLFVPLWDRWQRIYTNGWGALPSFPPHPVIQEWDISPLWWFSLPPVCCLATAPPSAKAALMWWCDTLPSHLCRHPLEVTRSRDRKSRHHVVDGPQCISGVGGSNWW